MKNHRYILEPYTGPSSRYNCPNCHKIKQFSRYLNTETGEILADHVGRCNRESKCGYHYKPKDFFRENPEQKPALSSNQFRKPEPTKKPVFIPVSEIEKTFQGYDRNTFVTFLKAKFGSAIAAKLVNTYLIGTSDDNWPGPGSAVFWFIDKQGRARAGQVKQFDQNGHTVKHTSQKGEKRSKTDWIHSQIKRKYESAYSKEPMPAWLSKYLQNEKVSCLFGEHLLKFRPGARIAIVEAPKTAIIASVYYPGFIWLAIGGLSYLTVGRVSALKGRKVYLFPDLKCSEKWHKQAQELSSIATFFTVDYLEQHATEEERERGLDLADYLTRFPPSTLKNATDYEPKTDLLSTEPPIKECEIRKNNLCTSAEVIPSPLNFEVPQPDNPEECSYIEKKGPVSGATFQLQPDEEGPEFYHYSYADLCNELGEAEALEKVKLYLGLSRRFASCTSYVIHTCKLLKTYVQRSAA